MLDKFLVLLERFVVAHELIAANSAKQPAVVTVDNQTEKNVELKVEGEEVIDTPDKPKGKPAAKPEPADDLDDEEPEEKPARKPRQAKPKEEPKGPDLTVLRDEIKTMAKAIAAGESDECCDLFDEMLEDYKVRTVTKLPDADVEEFHKEAKALVAKFYEIDED